MELRHEGACRLLAHGVDIRIIQLMYPYLEPEDLSEALAYAAWRAMEVEVEVEIDTPEGE